MNDDWAAKADEKIDALTAERDKLRAENATLTGELAGQTKAIAALVVETEKLREYQTELQTHMRAMESEYTQCVAERHSLRAYCDGLRQHLGPYSTVEIALKAMVGLREVNAKLLEINASQLALLNAAEEKIEKLRTLNKEMLEALKVCYEQRSVDYATVKAAIAKAEKEGGAK